MYNKKHTVLSIILCIAFVFNVSAKDNNFNRRMALHNLEKTKEATAIILELPSDIQKAAVQKSAGLLTIKLQEWGGEKISAGEMTHIQRLEIMTFAIKQLAILAQSVNWNEANICHIKEVISLESLLKGQQTSPVNCRQNVYDITSSLRFSEQLEKPVVFNAINDWSTSVILAGYNLIKSERAIE